MRSENMEKKHAKTPKEKRRNMERRKEKSRDAARCRRGRETEIFSDLSSLLPIPAAKVAHLDKASVIRVAISYLKIRDVVSSLPAKEENQPEIEGSNMDSLFVDSLEGFLLVTTTEGDIVFISESVNRYLGLQQVEVLGQSIFELSHPCDHAEIKEMLSTKDVNVQKSYFLRMKWNPKGRSANVNKSTQYKVIHYTGRLIPSKSHNADKEINNNAATSEDSDSGDSKQIVANSPAYHFVGIGEAIWHPANIEVPLGRNTFLSKHSLDMKYTYADERIVEFFGYNPEALIKKSIYDYHHAQDTVVIKNCFKNLFEKGQSQTERYRFLALGGGYAWVVTQSTLIYNNNQKPLSVVCVNFIVSEIENKNEIYSLCQLDNAYTPLTPVDSPRSVVAAAAPAPAATSTESYLYENSPQHLIEQLRIDRSSPPLYSSSSAKVAVEATKSRYSAIAPATNSQQQQQQLQNQPQHQQARQSSNKKKQSGAVKQQQRKVDPRPLGIEELLLAGNSSGYSSSSDLSSTSTSASPRETLDDYWLMNDDHQTEPLSFYALPCGNENDTLNDVSSTPSPSSSCNEQQQHSIETIEIENIRSNERPALSQTDDCVVVKVSDIPKPATVNVFVPFTEEMDKGFLRLDDTGLTMLKEDPEDLTHLAPTAGDVCVPLDENHIDYVLPDMLEDIMLNDCHLLSNDGDRDLSSSSPNSFFSYNRDDLEPSSRPLSPILTQQNEDCSIPSFCSDDSPLHDSSVNHFLDFALINPTDDIDDLSGKSPYIPLSLDQDPLLPFVTNDFMWGSSSAESSTWSSEPSSPTSNCSLSPRLDHTTSSLAKLLKAEPICNYDGGGDRENRGGGSANGVSTQNGAGGPTKHANSFGSNVNSLADRNYSNVGQFKTVAYHRNVNLINEMKRRTNSTVKKETCNNRSTDDKRTRNAHITAGNKRTVSENSWGRGANSCKRSKQTSRTIIVNGAAGGGGGGNNGNGTGTRRIQQESAAMAEAVAAAKQTNSVLMNLLVSGCDLNAGYDEDFRETTTVRGVSGGADNGGGGVLRYSNTTTMTPNKNLVSRVNNNNNNRNSNYQAKTNSSSSVRSLGSNSKCWSQSKKKSLNLFESESSRIPSLMDLTEQDYAVNAPSAGVLLQGSDLLKALECATVM